MIPTVKGMNKLERALESPEEEGGGRARAKREPSNGRANHYLVYLRGKTQNASEGPVAKLSESRMRQHQGKLHKGISAGKLRVNQG